VRKSTGTQYAGSMGKERKNGLRKRKGGNRETTQTLPFRGLFTGGEPQRSERLTTFQAPGNGK